jgi:hypothetical protein
MLQLKSSDRCSLLSDHLPKPIYTHPVNVFRIKLRDQAMCPSCSRPTTFSLKPIIPLLLKTLLHQLPAVLPVSSSTPLPWFLLLFPTHKTETQTKTFFHLFVPSAPLHNQTFKRLVSTTLCQRLICLKQILRRNWEG